MALPLVHACGGRRMERDGPSAIIPPPDLPTLLLPAAKVDYVNPAWVERVRAGWVIDSSSGRWTPRT